MPRIQVGARNALLHAAALPPTSAGRDRRPNAGAAGASGARRHSVGRRAPFLRTAPKVFKSTGEGLVVKRILIGVVLLVAVVGGLGFYQGWWRVSTEGTPNITIDQEKIKADEERAKKKAQELEQKAKENAKGTADKEKDGGAKP
jgi:hypothetical protein